MYNGAKHRDFNYETPVRMTKDIELMLLDYFTGTLPEDDRSEVEQWICESAENRRAAERICSLVQTSERIRQLNSADVDAALRGTRRRVDAMRRRRFCAAFGRVAAVLLIPVAVAGGIFAWKYFNPGECEMVQIRTTTGMTSSATLPDGTAVWLNSNSTLKYPTRFNGSVRRVNLTGEGYFDVVKTGRKFIVDAGAVNVEVLGTKFNVEAYEGNAEVKTTLESGRIRLCCQGMDGRTQVKEVSPGERCCYNTTTGCLRSGRVNTSCVTSWREGRILLCNTTLADALETVGNRYNVEFLVKNRALLDNRYTGVFTDQRLEVVLEHFRKTTDIHFDPVSGTDSASVSGRQKIIVY